MPRADVLYRAGGAVALAGGRRLVWYPSVFNAVTTVREPGDTYRETVAPTAFDGALAGDGEVYACIDHDPRRTFALRSDGTLSLKADSRGLLAWCELPDTPAGLEALALVRSGRATGGSFAFRPVAAVREAGYVGVPPLVTLRAVQLVDVTITGASRPVYPQTPPPALRSTAAQRERHLRLLRARTN